MGHPTELQHPLPQPANPVVPAPGGTVALGTPPAPQVPVAAPEPAPSLAMTPAPAPPHTIDTQPGATPQPGVVEPPPMLGSVIDGRYRVDGLIAEGGMGAVYRAEHVLMARPVALKVLHPQFAQNPDVMERFQREARICVQLRSPHVVEVYDFGRTPDGRCYLAMELLQGEPLSALLRRGGALAPARAIDLLRQLLQGLRAAHQAGVVHRDLKPDNLWLVATEQGEPPLKILDFGIAKLTRPSADAAQTQAGWVLGTPEYIAPEQVLGGQVDARSDLYAVGIIAFVMLTGRHPFPATDTESLLKAHVVTPVPRLDSVAPALKGHKALMALVERCTRKEAAQRPASAEELLTLLDTAGSALAKQQAAHAPPARAPKLAKVRKPSLARPDPPHPPVASYFPDLPLPGGRRTYTQNLAIMFTDIAGFTATTGRQTRAENAHLLATHDGLLLPVVKAFGGRLIKSIGDALLVVFRSPTDCVLCAMAMQDRLAQHNAGVAEADRIVVRVAANQGEVRWQRGDVFGEPVNIAARVEGVTPADEIWLSEGVYLAMNQNEVALEPVGERELKGLSEAIKLYRVKREEGPLPYGGRQLARVDASGGALETMAQWPAQLAAGWRAGFDWLKGSRWRLAGAGAVGVALLAALVAGGLWASNPQRRAGWALAQGEPQRALSLLAAAPADAPTLMLRGRALHELGRGDDGVSAYRQAHEKAAGILARGDVIDDLVDDLGGGRSKEAAELLVAVGDPAVEALAMATVDDVSKRRWAAVELLRKLGREDRADLVGAYLADLQSKDCDVVARAARRLGELGDRRAIGPLREVAERKVLFLDACEAPAARAALRKLEKN